MNLSFFVKKDINFVYEHLTDIQKFVAVHPIISRMDKIGKEQYLVYETLHIGFIPFSFTYLATIEGNLSEKTVVMRAVVMRFTKIEMVYNLKATNNSTEIEESISFSSPLPIKWLMQRIFRKQHAQLFHGIEMTKD